MPEEMRELADAARDLGFTAEEENHFGLSGDTITGGLTWLVLAIGTGAASLVVLNAALKAAAELPENWRRLLEKLRSYDRTQLSGVLQLETVHRWLDEQYGPRRWRIDYDAMLVKQAQNASVFDFREEHSGNLHRILVVNRELAVLRLTRPSGSAPKPVAGEQSTQVDLAVVTILPEEYRAVLCCLDTHQHVRGSAAAPNIYSWEIGTVRAGNDEYVVVVALAGDPTIQVGAVVTQATIERFDPRYVVLVGVAGGLAVDGQEHGDVVVSKTIYGYEYGKIDSGFQPRQDFTHRVDQGITNAMSAFVAGGGDWWNAIQAMPPREKLAVAVRLGAVASGNKVVDDVDDSFFAAVVRAWPKLLAVEMEGAGAAIAIESALAMGRQVGFAMVRGISDMPRTRVGTAERDAWKSYAAEAAARFLIAVLRERWPVPPRLKEGDPPRDDGRIAKPSKSFAPATPEPSADTKSDQAAIRDQLKIIKSEASRMEKHGTSLNAGFHYGYWNQYLPLKFRPAILEAALVQVLATIAHDNVLVSNLDALRAAAAAADSETDRVLQDGRLVLDRLRPFVLQVVSNASQVVSGIDRILGPMK